MYKRKQMRWILQTLKTDNEVSGLVSQLPPNALMDMIGVETVHLLDNSNELW